VLLTESKQAIVDDVPEAVAISQNSNDIVDITTASCIIYRKKSTIYGLVHQKEIPYIKQRKKLLFSRKALTEWLNSQTQIHTSTGKGAATHA
jgi:excisionase family DNA binding protein